MAWRAWRCLAGLGLALMIVTAGGAGWPWCLPRNPVLPVTYPEEYRPISRAATVAPLANQAANGAAVEQTVWNHFFTESEDVKVFNRLHPAGVAYLNRMARRAASDPACGPLNLFVQRVQKLPYIPGGKGKLQDVLETRAHVDQQRVEAVRQYMAANWPHVPVRVEVNDPPEASYSAREGILIYTPHIRGVFGFLPLPIQGGLSIAPEKLARGLGTASDVPSVTGSAAASAFGTEALPSPSGGGSGTGLGGDSGGSPPP